MGGFRSIFLAFLDRDVKVSRPSVPWMTDLYAYVDTTRQPTESTREWIGTLRYFDSVFAAKRVDCPMYITAWLGDYICPPAGIMVLFNNANKLSTIDFGQNGTHFGALAKPEKLTHSKINKNNSHFLFDWF